MTGQKLRKSASHPRGSWPWVALAVVVCRLSGTVDGVAEELSAPPASMDETPSRPAELHRASG